MKYYVEKPLREFRFWGGAKSTVDYLRINEIDIIENVLKICRTMTDEEINDYFWFETDEIARILGYNSFDEIMKRVSLNK